MKYVSLQPRAPTVETQSGRPPLEPDELAAFTAGLSLRDCQVIDHIVASECLRRGWGRQPIGSRKYSAVEAAVVADICVFALDLWEIGAQMEEARWSHDG
jgi:hypothetical protein